MGTVFLGEHTLIGRHAAIKVLLPELSSKRESVDRFFNEARATTAISDPGIVQVFDFGFTSDNIAYIVMELLEGEQLNLRLERLGVLAPADALRITRQAAGSLGAAHAAGIVHRDLKPDNLYMIRDPEAPGGERPKILDFGIAKLGDDVPDRIKTRTGAVLGTPVYMSPEQCDGASKVDHRADIYSLGCVLFHLLTGKPPFDLPGLGAIISAHLREPPPPPTSLVPELPSGLDELVLRCLAKSPEDRFATMSELQQACDTILARITLGSGRLLAMASGSMPAVPRMPPLGDASQTAHDASASGSLDRKERNPFAETTLSTSAGQPSVVLPRRRLGLWLVLAALAGGTGSTIAVLTARPSAHEAPAAPPAPRAVVAPEEPHVTQVLDAGAAPVATTPAIPSDAGAAAKVPDAAPLVQVPGRPSEVARPPTKAPSPPTEVPSRPRPAAPARNPDVAKPATKTKPKPKTEDLYDDRN